MLGRQGVVPNHGLARITALRATPKCQRQMPAGASDAKASQGDNRAVHAIADLTAQATRSNVGAGEPTSARHTGKVASIGGGTRSRTAIYTSMYQPLFVLRQRTNHELWAVQGFA
jgi:hypothetical protein